MATITNSNIRSAVQLWSSDQQQASSTYGDISNWQLGSVTDVSYLFQDMALGTSFNGISSWQMSSVTNMACTQHV